MTLPRLRRAGFARLLTDLHVDGCAHVDSVGGVAPVLVRSALLLLHRRRHAEVACHLSRLDGAATTATIDDGLVRGVLAAQRLVHDALGHRLAITLQLDHGCGEEEGEEEGGGTEKLRKGSARAVRLVSLPSSREFRQVSTCECVARRRITRGVGAGCGERTGRQSYDRKRRVSFCTGTGCVYRRL